MLHLFRRRSVDLKSLLRQTKKVRIQGVDFEIRQVDLQDHMAGLNVILGLWDLYKRDKPKDPVKVMEDNAKLRKFMRDFIYAGVVSPKLTLKDPPEEDAIPVDELTLRIDLAQELCQAIIENAYGKKN